MTSMQIPTAVSEFSRVKRLTAWVFRGWTGGSIVAGGLLLLLFREHALVGALGVQFLIWGLINAVFVVRGWFDTDPAALDWGRAETRSLLLNQLRPLSKWMDFNHKLDLLWVSMGLVLLIASWIWWSAGLLGHGLGVFIQGAALLAIDRWFDGGLKRCLRGLE